MSDKLNEQISALVDGELSQVEEALFVRRLVEDRNLQGALARYQLISDAMRGTLPQQVDTGFSQRVREVLDADPVVKYRTVRMGSFLKPLAGLAVAASIALVAVLSLQTIRQDEVPAVATAPADSDYIRVNDREQLAVSQRAGKVQTRKRLDAYLVNHNEFAVSRSMRGMLSYVRIVGHELGEEDKE